MNISEHVGKLRKYMEFRNYSPRSVENYCSNFTGFLATFEKKGITHPDRITAEMIIEFLSGFKEPATHSGYHSAIKIYYQKVAKVGIEKFKFIERPKKNKKLPIVLSIQEVQAIINVCTNLKHKTIIVLMYSSAIRVSEVINLKIKDIDSKRMIINIIKAKGKKDRQVGLNEPLLQLLRSYFLEYKPVEYLFNGQGSLQYSARSIAEFLQKYADAAGLRKHVNPHLLRHTSATHLVENGVDINIIQRLLGHNNVKTTAIYTHISSNLISNISPISNIQINK